MDLPSVFKHKGWSIRYNILQPDSSPQSQPQPPLKPIIFVHGTPWNSIVFKPLISALVSKKSYKILVYDIPGYGQSQDLDTDVCVSERVSGFIGDTSVRSQAEVLATLLNDRGVGFVDGGTGPPAVVAHDIGGAVVLRAHLLHRSEFSAMFFMETNCVLPWGDGFYKLCREEAGVFVRLPLAIFEAVVRAVVRSACFNPGVLGAGMEEELVKYWVGSREGQESFVRQIAQANDGDVGEMLRGDMYGDVRCGVRILWGEEDQWIPREKMEELGKRLGDKMDGFVVVEGAGHLVMLDRPERVAIEVFDWLGGSGS